MFNVMSKNCVLYNGHEAVCAAPMYVGPSIRAIISKMLCHYGEHHSMHNRHESAPYSLLYTCVHTYICKLLSNQSTGLLISN